MKNLLFILHFFTLIHGFSQNKLRIAYQALDSYDYFKAKKLFYTSLHQYPYASAFGLATIFSRNDNPFYNIDSAARYIIVSNQHFKDTSTYFSYHLNQKNNHALTSIICQKGYETYGRSHSTKALNHFLTHFHFAPDSSRKQVFYVRDSIRLAQYADHGSSDSMRLFLMSYPESQLYLKAQQLFYVFQYAEHTKEHAPAQFKHFITHYPSNPFVKTAERSLFELTKELHHNDSLYEFIKQYSTDETKEEAWKLLYSNSVKNYHEKELYEFMDKYPDYPYHSAIMKEISLSQKMLLPFENNESVFGYIDTLGHWVIKPLYDDASVFVEGVASVCRNDSCFYINKEGIKTSPFYFDEAENYQNGTAIVKKGKYYFLINRSGQFITNGYEDMNMLSDGLHVCKQNNLYGAINHKGETVIPFMYKQLGNFKKGYAYYLSNHYGLVSITNTTLTAQWDWVSDVDANSLVTVKRGEKFGLMALDEQLLINPEFDVINIAKNGVYILVKANFYGFYDAKERCFITSIDYNYDKKFDTDYYTNGTQFKLIQNGKVALIDANGRFSINFGVYDDLFFAKCDVIRVRKNNNYGFVDRKLKTLISAEYTEASDFDNGVAIVSKKDNYYLINKEGEVLVNMGQKIEKITSSVYLTNEEGFWGLVNHQGVVLLTNEYTAINPLNGYLFRCQKNNDLFLYNTQKRLLFKVPLP